MKVQFTGKVNEQGKLYIVNRADFDKFVSEFAGKEIYLTVERKKSKRSNPQNSYYWAGVIPIIRNAINELGHRLTHEETHEFLKMKFLKVEILDDDVLIGERTRSTTELNKSEFGDYIAEIQQFAAEILNVIVPDPQEQTKLNVIP